MREVVAADAENKAGLKKKFQFRILMADATKLLQQNKTAEGESVIGNALALRGVTGDQIQQADFQLALHYLRLRNLEKGVELLKKALDAAPHSPRSRWIKNLIKQNEKQLKSQKDAQAKKDSQAKKDAQNQKDQKN